MFPKEEGPKFRGVYRIPSNRLVGYDYSQTGLYFVTICTKDRKKYFGEVNNGMVALSPVGLIVKEELLKTPTLRSNVSVDEWAIMPNHMHVIIGIDNQENEKQWNGKLADKLINDSPVETHCVRLSPNQSTNTSDQIDVDGEPRDACNASLQPAYMNTFGPQRNNLASIVRGFKAATTKQINEQFRHLSFSWQPRFHDHIIRTDESLAQIRQYILENPVKWFEDEMFVE